eukprot:TRINITY_DN24734_c0_g1_i1.p1 TRINITY_DN24734_c0_g1~~TRINITY_DN24734_c0_g1_i1.p1  ORF type:complete len:822 (+),score=190.98 TRINITY_DN24734_c0_g1_i1:79-2544(+)
MCTNAESGSPSDDWTGLIGIEEPGKRYDSSERQRALNDLQACRDARTPESAQRVVGVAKTVLRIRPRASVFTLVYALDTVAHLRAPASVGASLAVAAESAVRSGDVLRPSDYASAAVAIGRLGLQRTDLAARCSRWIAGHARFPSRDTAALTVSHLSRQGVLSDEQWYDMICGVSGAVVRPQYNAAQHSTAGKKVGDPQLAAAILWAIAARRQTVAALFGADYRHHADALAASASAGVDVGRVNLPFVVWSLARLRLWQRCFAVAQTLGRCRQWRVGLPVEGWRVWYGVEGACRAAAEVEHILSLRKRLAIDTDSQDTRRWQRDCPGLPHVEDPAEGVRWLQRTLTRSTGSSRPPIVDASLSALAHVAPAFARMRLVESGEFWAFAASVVSKRTAEGEVLELRPAVSLLWALVSTSAPVSRPAVMQLTRGMQFEIESGRANWLQALQVLWCEARLGNRPSPLTPPIARFLQTSSDGGCKHAHQPVRLLRLLADELSAARLRLSKDEFESVAADVIPALAVVLSSVSARLDEGTRNIGMVAVAALAVSSALWKWSSGAAPRLRQVLVDLCDFAAKASLGADATPLAAANLLKAFALNRLRPPRSVIELVCSAFEKRRAAGKVVSRAWWSAAALRIHDLHLLRALATALEDAADELGPRHVSESMWALAKQLELSTRFTGEEATPPTGLVQALTKRALALARSMSPADCEHVLFLLRDHDKAAAARFARAAGAAEDRPRSDQPPPPRRPEPPPKQPVLGATPLADLAAGWKRGDFAKNERRGDGDLECWSSAASKRAGAEWTTPKDKDMSVLFVTKQPTFQPM